MHVTESAVDKDASSPTISARSQIPVDRQIFAKRDGAVRRPGSSVCGKGCRRGLPPSRGLVGREESTGMTRSSVEELQSDSWDADLTLRRTEKVDIARVLLILFCGHST